MKRVIFVLLTALLCMSVITACHGKKKESITSSASADEAISYETIKTPYADLRVTESFYQETATTVTSENPYVLLFKSKSGDELFSLHFGQKADTLLGTLKLPKENVVIYAKFAKLDAKSENYDHNCILQEEINVIIENLSADYDFMPDTEKQETTPADDTAIETFDIKTSVTTLKYPAMWKEKVKVDVSDNEVKFADGETPLFDLRFTEGDGYLLGTYKKTPIYVVYHDVKTLEQNTMVEDVNVILQNLMKDSNFTVHYANQ